MNFLTKLLTSVCLLIACNSAMAWPERPLTLVLPVPPGGGTDILARTLQPQLVRQLGQPVILLHKPGAKGLAAIRHVLEKQDDHTVLFTTTDVVVDLNVVPPKDINPKDLVSVHLLVSSSILLAVHPESPHRDFGKTLAALKQGRAVTVGSPGVGTTSHLVLERMAEILQKSPTIVHYKGGNPMVIDTLGGHVNLGISSYGGTFQPWLEKKQLAGTMIFRSQRAPQLPDVPTAKELGFDIVAATTNGVFASSTMPASAIQRLSESFKTALEDPMIKNQISQRGQDVINGSSASLDTFIRSEIKTWADIIKKHQ